MQPSKLTIEGLFQRERRYVVPLYQRAYVWKQDEQWEPLWEDIERQAEACISSETGQPRRPHFMGAIVLNVAKIVGSSVARSEVIDGQQRLTTLQVFLAALRDYAEAIGSAHARKVGRLTTNADEDPGSEGSFKVWPTNADRGTFRAVMEAGSLARLMERLDIQTRDALPRLAGAYAYFSDVIRTFVESGATDENFEARDKRIFGLLQAMRTALQLVVIELEDDDDPQVIFETLNARGQPLLPSDLIRNFVFLKAANDPALDADTLYDRFWREFDDRRLPAAVEGEDRFWHVPERQGRLTRPRIDLFMFHYLAMKTGHELNIGQLFREFRDWREDADDVDKPIPAFLADLRAYSDIFGGLIDPQGQDRSARLARRLKSLDTSTVYPVLMYLLGLPRTRLSAPDRDAILGDIESWLIRRMVCQLTNKNYNKFFLQLLVRLKEAKDDADLPALVRAELMRSNEPTLKWPTDEDFRRGWLSKPVYVKSRPDRSAMLLLAIEDAIRTSKNEPIIVGGPLSVEHLLPQKGAIRDYPFAPAEAEEGRDPADTDATYRARLIHTMGNLTLLTQALNSGVSNGAFPGKRSAIAQDSDLRLNAWLRDPAQTTWTEQDILNRGEILFETARRVWSRPA